MATIGEVSEIPWEFVTQWKIKDFMSLSSKEDEFYYSPLFSFANISWCLQIYPNGETKITQSNGEFTTSIGNIDMYLHRKSTGPPINLEFTLGLKTLDEKIDLYTYENCTYAFKTEGGYGFYSLVCRSNLIKRKSVLMPAGVLTVVCKMRYPKSTQIANDRVLCEDYKKVLLNGINHDIILKVDDKELRAHQDILRVRSPVFESMLSHDMKEKNTGVINMPDCDPQAMEQFLSYIYSGKVDTLDERNMLNLYYIADKYDVKGLKEECHSFIKNSLSLTNICEVIQFSLKHSDSSLTDYATEFFMDNGVEIMRTVEWESFMKDNFTVANELTIKSVEKLKNVKM